MTDSAQATLAATVVDELVRNLVTDAVICPGSRSTPLAVALAGDGRVRVRVVLDERSAGFVGVGLGLARGLPAVVLTTSGTAAVELHPAVVEADQARVPLIVCTADRPPDLHGVGAPQTVPQASLFAGATRWAATVDPLAVPASAWRSITSRAVAEAVDGARGPGPVHLNLPFREPLLGRPGALPAGRHDLLAWHEALRSPLPADGGAVATLADMAAAGRRGVIVAGAGAGPADDVHAAAAALGWPVLADPRSGCRRAGPTTVATADALLRDDDFARAHRPEVLLRLGAPWVSRVVSSWLADQDEALQVLVDPYGAWLEPERQAAWVLAADPGVLCRTLAAALSGTAAPGRGAWADGWARSEEAAQSAIDAVLARHPEPTGPGVARDLHDVLPDGATLVAAASLPMREVEWFARPRTGVRVLANRGANGIDGVLSTAVGVACAERGGPVVALLGDLALLHDVGGLLTARWTGAELTLVVVDNGGGGIFSFLPQAGELPPAEFERLFGTPHGLDLQGVLEGFGVPTVVVGSASGVGPAVAQDLDRPGPGAVLVRTDRGAGPTVHDEIHAAVAAGLAATGERRRPTGPGA